jgi:phosphoribosylanthranilate isomerase
MVMITLSGIDEKTDLSAFSQYRNGPCYVELAILLSANPEGRNRYPSLEWIREAVKNKDLNLAVHLCGSEARKRALAGEYSDIIGAFKVQRVQVNGKVSVEQLKSFCNMLRLSTIITQDCPVNLDLAKLSSDCHKSPFGNWEILIDGSGGKGIERENWDLPEHLLDFKNYIGFAGGLGPDNLDRVLEEINSNNLWFTPWVDMESKLRDENDWFSVDKAKQCIDIVINHNKKQFFGANNEE